MKVLYIFNTSNFRDGSIKSLLTLISGLQELGIVASAVVQRKGEMFTSLSKKGIHTYVLPLRFNTYPLARNMVDKLLFLPRFVFWQVMNVFSYLSLLNVVRHEKFDIIHTNVSVINIGFKVAKRLRIPHVFHVREYVDKDFGLHYFPTDRYLRKTLENSYSICITKDIQLHHKLNTSRRSSVIYNGIIYQSQIKTNPIKERYFLYVGRIEPAKGLDVLVKAYHKYVLDTSVTVVPLLVAGEVSDTVFYKNLLRYIQSNGLSKYISFFGGRDDVFELMRKALAIIIPSVFEGFGRCMAEAMFNGCLVIAHDTGGLKEQFDNGKELCGGEIGLRYKTELQLSGHLQDVSKRPYKFYSDMICRASSVVGRLYSIEVYVNSVYDVYKRMLGVSENND